jgi:hypothetical protein
VIDALRAAIEDALRRLSPEPEAAKACRYGVKPWPELTRYLDDGKPVVDSGITERAPPSVAFGRRDWPLRQPSPKLARAALRFRCYSFRHGEARNALLGERALN